MLAEPSTPISAASAFSPTRIERTNYGIIGRSRASGRALRVVLVVLAILSSSSCLSRPTQAEIDCADIGPRPDYELARQAAESLLRARLREREPNKYEPDRLRQTDESSAEIAWDASVHRGWYEPASSACFGWQLTADVNARNDAAELTGSEPWSFWFRYGSLVAIAEPSRMGCAGCAEELARPIRLEPDASDHLR